VRAVGDKQKETIRPDFDTSITIDFQGAKITSDTGFLVMREIDQRFSILSTAASKIDDPRSARHTDHSLLQLLRQRVYQVAAGYEDCNDAEHLRVDPALRLALGKEHESGAGQSALCRFENGILATPQGLKALESAVSRSADTLLRRRNKRRLILMLIPLRIRSMGTKKALLSTVILSRCATILCFASRAKAIF
jgi:hypothetical protein